MITKEMTVGDVLREKPASAHLLMSHGICNCCGGHLTLEESAQSKGVNIEDLLERLNNKK
jgi:iron-sulfur cluster repair protein YtfE (RIC family)